jgi:hypothetical protein
MLLIIVILLVAYIVVPLIELTLVERVRTAVTITVYILAFAYILYVLIVGRMIA